MPTLVFTPEKSFAWITTFPNPEPMSRKLELAVNRKSSLDKVSSFLSNLDMELSVVSPYVVMIKENE